MRVARVFIRVELHFIGMILDSTKKKSILKDRIQFPLLRPIAKLEGNFSPSSGIKYSFSTLLSIYSFLLREKFKSST